MNPRTVSAWAVVLASAVCVSASRQCTGDCVRLSRPGDAEGDAVRAVASDFYVKLAAADVAGARALFAGPADQGQLIDATIASTVALDRFVGALAAKFGASETLKPWEAGGAAYKRRQAEEAKGKLVALVGDQAVVAGSALADLGLRMKREAGAWKIVGLTPASDSAGRYVTLANRLAAASDTVRARVEAGGFYRLEPALTEVARLNDEAMAEWKKAGDEAEDEAFEPGVMSTAPSADALSALPGKTIGSAEVTAFLASLSTLPELTASADGTVLTFVAAGVTLGFDAADEKLTALTLHDQDDGGFAKYPGPLPAGLAFGARRSAVEQLLGRPVWSLGETEYAADFPDKGVTLTFTGKDARDPDAVLHRVDVSAPRPNAARVTGAIRGLALRLVAAPADPDAAAVALLEPGTDGVRELRLKPSPLATGVGLERVLPNYDPQSGNWGVELAFTSEAGKALAAATGAARGQTLAVVAGERIVAAIKIEGPFGERLVLNLGDQASPEAARGLAGQLHAATFTLP